MRWSGGGGGAATLVPARGELRVGAFESACGSSSGAAGDFVLGNVTNKPIRFFTNNLERMAISGGGYVGIGVANGATTPSVEKPLTVTNPIGTSQAFVSFRDYAGNYRLFDFVEGSAGAGYMRIKNQSVNKVQLNANGDSYFMYDVGIDVTDPDERLEVNGRIHIGETTAPSAPSDGDGGKLYAKSDGKLYYISNEVAEVELSSSGGGGGTGTAIAMALVFGSTYS